MRSRIAFITPPTALILAVLACTFGQATPPSNPVGAAATIVAMTLAAEGVSTSPASAATESPSPMPATATATAKPALKINVNGAQCRSGPGPDFDLIASFDSGITVDLIARDTADGFWLVKDPNSGSSCWVQTQDSTASGSFDLLPEVTPQAVIAKEVPAKPGSSSSFNYWEYSCGVGSSTVNLRWIDAADDETGYRVYRNGELIAELPAGSTSYTDIVTSGGSLSYSVRAYNDAGESPPLNTPNFSC